MGIPIIKRFNFQSVACLELGRKASGMPTNFFWAFLIWSGGVKRPLGNLHMSNDSIFTQQWNGNSIWKIWLEFQAENFTQKKRPNHVYLNSPKNSEDVSLSAFLIPFLKKKNSLSVWITLGFSVKRLSSRQNIYWTAGRDVRHRSNLCLKTSVFRAFRSYVLMCRRIAVEMLAQVGMRVSCMSGIFLFLWVAHLNSLLYSVEKIERSV